MIKPLFEGSCRSQYYETDLSGQVLGPNRHMIGNANPDRTRARTQTKKTERFENPRMMRGVSSDIDGHCGAVSLERPRQREIRPLERSDR
jgi:hypothetical protein